MQFNLSALRTWLHNNNRSLATLHRAKWPDERCFDSAMNTVLSALEQAGSVKKASVTATIQILQSASLTLEDELVSDCFFNIVNCMVRECKEARPLGHMHPTVMLKPEKNFTDLSDTAAYRELRDVPLLQLKQGRNSNLSSFRAKIGRLIVWLLLRCGVPNSALAVTIIKDGQLVYFANQMFIQLADENIQRFSVCDTTTLLLLDVRREMAAIKNSEDEENESGTGRKRDVDVRLARLGLKSFGKELGLIHLTEQQIIGYRKYLGSVTFGPVLTQLFNAAVTTTELPNHVFHRLLTGQRNSEITTAKLPENDLAARVKRSLSQSASPVKSIDEIHRIKQLKERWLAHFLKPRLGKSSYKGICAEIEKDLSQEENHFACMTGYWLIAMVRDGGLKKSQLAASTITQYFSAIFQPAMDVFINIEPKRLSPSEWLDCLQNTIDGIRASQQKKYVVYFADFLMRAGIVNDISLDELELPEPQTRVDANLVSPADIDLLLMALMKQNDAKCHLATLFVALGFYAGLRRNEILGLCMSDVQPYVRDGVQCCTIKIRPNKLRKPKSAAGVRNIELQPLLPNDQLSFLVKIRQGLTDNKKSAPLFYNPSMATSAMRLASELLREVTADRSIRFHHLRHSCASFSFLRLFYRTWSNSRWRPVFMQHSYFDNEACENFVNALCQGYGDIFKWWHLCEMLGHSESDITFSRYVHIRSIAVALQQSAYLHRADAVYIWPDIRLSVNYPEDGFREGTEHRSGADPFMSQFINGSKRWANTLPAQDLQSIIAKFIKPRPRFSPLQVLEIIQHLRLHSVETVAAMLSLNTDDIASVAEAAEWFSMNFPDKGKPFPRHPDVPKPQAALPPGKTESRNRAILMGILGRIATIFSNESHTSRQQAILDGVKMLSLARERAGYAVRCTVPEQVTVFLAALDAIGIPPENVRIRLYHRVVDGLETLTERGLKSELSYWKKRLPVKFADSLQAMPNTKSRFKGLNAPHGVLEISQVRDVANQKKKQMPVFVQALHAAGIWLKYTELI